jgi:hypothetical protein
MALAIGNFIPTLRREGQQQLLLLVTGFLPFAVHEFSDLLATPFTRFITGNRLGLRWNYGSVYPWERKRSTLRLLTCSAFRPHLTTEALALR